VTGVLAFVALAMPWLVIIGMMALIVPGLILALMPTAFMYGAVFACVWYPGRRRLGAWGASAAGVALVAVLLGALPTLVNSRVPSLVAATRDGDREPTAPAAIAGVLRIERDRNTIAVAPLRKGERRTYACGDLCATGLFTPGVTAVALAGAADAKPRSAPSSNEDLTAVYRLAPKPANEPGCPDPGLREDGPNDLGTWPEVNALRVAWKLALAAGTCVVRDPLEAAPRAADFTLRFQSGTLLDTPGGWGFGPRVRYSRIVLADAARETLRTTSVTASVLQTPLWIEPTGGMESFRFGWARRVSTTGAYEAVDVLKRTTNLGLTPAAATVDEPTGADVRGALVAALDDPTKPPEAAAFTLVRPLFDAMGSSRKRPDVRPGDAALVARLVADRRIRDFSGIHQPIRALGPEAAALRGPMVRRVLAASYPEDRGPAQTLGSALSALPVGLFATPTSEEEQLLADADRRRWASGLVLRQADRGATVAPALVRIIEQAYARPIPKRSYDDPDRLSDANAAVHALCLIGPEAGFVLPSLEALIETGSLSPRALDSREWQTMLTRLGKPVESFTKPANLSGTQEAFEERLRSRLTRFKPEYCR
jgi:hypothetical protein